MVIRRKQGAPDESKRWFREAAFGMFIHWGVYSVPGHGEWVMYHEHIPPEEYAEFARQFKPKRWNPEAWVRLAKEAGMKYMVLTAKHADGYCLFDSQVSDFTSVKTAAGRDFVEEFISACRRFKMKVGLYYCLPEWRHAGHEAGSKKPKLWRPFVEYAHAQVSELCTRYGKLDILWYDGVGKEKKRAYRSDELMAKVRRLQPEILINDRSGLPGDFLTFEQRFPTPDPGGLWESCMTINDSWGYHAGDRNWKTTPQLITILAACAHNGGNLLLNVGPKADGTIPPSAVHRLREIGEWLKENGEAIYGVAPHPFGYADQRLSTARGNVVYFFLNPWPGGSHTAIREIGNKVNSAHLILDRENRKISFRQERGRLFLNLPRRQPYPCLTTLKVELDGRPRTISEPKPGGKSKLDKMSQFHDMSERVKRLLTGMEEVTDSVVHDLRSPISRMRMAAELALARERSGKEYREVIAEIMGDLDRLLALMNTTLEISEAEAGAMKLNLVEINATEVINEVCDMFRSAAEHKGLVLRMDGKSPVKVRADRGRLRQTIANLVDNSLKYTLPGGEICVSAAKEREGVVIQVRDTGIGIPRSSLSRVFDRFYRVNGSRAESGHGLGLSFARAIVRAHGGEITVWSQQGKGTRFTVTLPCGAQDTRRPGEASSGRATAKNITKI